MPATATLARMFVALWPTPAERETVARWMRGCTWPPRAAIVAPERVHLTLHFLGDVPRDRIGAILEALPAPIPRFTLRFDRAALWHGGLAVLEASEVPPALAELHRATGEALRALGFTPEARHYRPHVTLARRAHGALLAEASPALVWRPAKLVLVESLRGAAAAYRIVSRA